MLKIFQKLSSQKRRLFLLTFSAFLLLLPGRASIPPFDRDEPRYMQATAQMLESHNFVDVRFQNNPRYLQPAGIYWLEAASVSLTDTLKTRSVWGWRLPSLIAMTSAIFLTAQMGMLLFGPVAGLMGGALLASSVLVQAEGRMATIDSTLLLIVVLIQFVFLTIIRRHQESGSVPARTAVLFWFMLGCGLMLKGPVVLIPGLATPFAFALVSRDRTLLRQLRPAWGWLIMLSVVLPWCAAIGIISHGEFFQRAVGRNFLGKIGNGQEAHGAFPGYHLLVFAIAFWPGAFFAAASLPIIAAWKKNWKVRFLLCWIIPHWVIFELIATKLPHYVLPVYPAIAILTGAALASSPQIWKAWPARKWVRILLKSYGVLSFLVGVALGVAGIGLSYALEKTVPVSAWLTAAGSLPLLSLALYTGARSELWKSCLCAISAAVIIYCGLFLGIIPQLQTIWLAPRLTALVNDYRPCTDTEVVSSSFSEPSLVFLMHGNVELKGTQDAALMLQRNPSCGLALISDRDFPAFQKAMSEGRYQPVEYDTVSGFNYSNGKWLRIGLYGAVSR